MNKRLRKKKLKQKRNNYIELPLDKLLDVELLESKEYGERLREWQKEMVEKLKKSFYQDINIEAIDKEYKDMLERVKEKLENE